MSKGLVVRGIVILAGVMLLALVSACAAEKEIVEVEKQVVVEKEVVKEIPVQVVVEKEVIKEVPVDRVMVKEVPVEKIVKEVVEVEKEVVKEVPVEVVVKEEVVKVVEVEKPVIVREEVVREVVKEVEVMVKAEPRKIAHVFQRATEGNPRYGGFLRIGFPINATHFDLHQGGPAYVFTPAYSGLVVHSQPGGNHFVVGDLASSWDVTPDGKSYTFHIREGVQFHDGAPLTIDDILTSMHRLIFPPAEVASRQAANFPFVESVTAPDETTIKFTLSGPKAYFLDILSGDTMIVYSKQELEANNNDLRKVKIAQGSGPWRFLEHTQNESVIFERNPNFFDPAIPYPDRLSTVHTPNTADRGLFVLTGLADFTWGTTRDVWIEAQKDPDKFGTGFAGSPGMWSLHINAAKAPFDDERIRRAMHLTLSRQIIQDVFKNAWPAVLTGWQFAGSPNLMSPMELEQLPGWRPDKAEDIAVAKQLMADAGFADGIKDVDLLTPKTDVFSQLLAPSIQEQLKRHLNIETSIRVIERPVYVEETNKGNYTLGASTVGAANADPAINFSALYKTGTANYNFGYSNPEFDALVDKIDAETSVSKREALVRQAEAILERDVPAVMLGNSGHQTIWRTYVKGMSFKEGRAFSQFSRVYTGWLDQ